MNRLIQKMTTFTSLFYLGLALIGKSVAAGPLLDPGDLAAPSNKSPHLSRSPASANPLLNDTGVDRLRPGLSILQAVPDKSSIPRWRLMGSCRQDIGMQRSLHGLGYGDCRN